MVNAYQCEKKYSNLKNTHKTAFACKNGHFLGKICTKSCLSEWNYIHRSSGLKVKYNKAYSDH